MIFTIQLRCSVLSGLCHDNVSFAVDLKIIV